VGDGSHPALVVFSKLAQLRLKPLLKVFLSKRSRLAASSWAGICCLTRTIAYHSSIFEESVLNNDLMMGLSLLEKVWKSAKKSIKVGLQRVDCDRKNIGVVYLIRIRSR
jgi:hypothetical protein